MTLEELFIKWQHEIDYFEHIKNLRPKSAIASEASLMIKTISSFINDLKNLDVATVKRSELIEELETLILNNEDDFDRGKGKYILREWISSINAT